MAIEVSSELDEGAFVADPHGAKYLSTLRAHPEAFARLLALLNDPVAERRMTSVPPGEPALGGIVDVIESDPAIGPVVASGAQGLRFRQAIGVAIRLRMEQIGWAAAGSKGTVRRSKHFGRAERYRPAGAAPGAQRALAALDAVAQIGTPDERRQTGEELHRDLRATRSAAARPY